MNKLTYSKWTALYCAVLSFNNWQHVYQVELYIDKSEWLKVYIDSIIEFDKKKYGKKYI